MSIVITPASFFTRQSPKLVSISWQRSLLCLSGSPQKEGKLEYHFFHSSVGFGVTYFGTREPETCDMGFPGLKVVYSLPVFERNFKL